MVNVPRLRPKIQDLGTGVSFPIRVNQQGNLMFSSQLQNVQESILLILLTEIGERLYRPDFGCRIHELAFAPLNSQTLMLMKIYVTEALEKWEPRIILNEVITQPKQRQGRVDIMINYQLRNTYDRRSMIYPFYIKQEREQAQLPNS